MRVTTLGLVVTLLCVAGLARAHHSSIPWYNLNADQITVTGIVKEFQFINPHVYVILVVTNSDGSIEEWKVESTSRNRLVRIGWTEDSIRPGQKVSATGFPAWEGNGVDSERIVVDDDALVWER